MSRARRHLFDDDDDDDEAVERKYATRTSDGPRNGTLRDRTQPEELEASWRPSKPGASGVRSTAATHVVRRNGLSRSSADTLTDIRNLVKGDYPEALTEAFQPITLALEMLDTSSLGRHRELDKFRAINREIEQTLQGTVNEHFQGFNSSIGTHTYMVASVERCQKSVTSTRDMLLRAKAQLSIQRSDLLELTHRAKQLNEVLQILKDIAELKRVPDELEAALATKDFAQVAEVYLHANDLAYRESLLNIGALRDIRVYLRAQSSNLVEVLIEELHNHLYLKSPYCDNRWSAYRHMQNELPRLDEIDVVSAAAASEGGSEEIAAGSELGTKRNPETDTKSYIETLVRSLQALGKLPFAIDVVMQRMASEIGATVDRTAAEVRARHPHIAFGVETTLFDADGDIDEQVAEPLRDLLWTLFSKWEAMFTAHMSFESATSTLLDSSRGTRPSRGSAAPAYLGVDRRAVWSAFENELRRLIADYLAQTTASTSGSLAGKRRKDELFLRKEGVRSSQRAVFDLKGSLNSLNNQEQTDATELHRMIGDSVPGLLSETSIITGLPSEQPAAECRSDRMLLTQPSPLNVVVVLPPVIALLQRISDQLDDTSAAGDYTSRFLDEVFYRQLSGAMDQFLLFAISDSASAWNVDMSLNTGVQMSANLLNTVKLLQKTAVMVEMMPVSVGAHEATVLRILTSALTYCRRRYENTTQRSAAREDERKLSAAWSDRPQIRAIWHQQLCSSQRDLDQLVDCISHETEALRELRTGLILNPELLLRPSGYATLVGQFASLREFVSLIATLVPHPRQSASTSGRQRQGLPWYLPRRKCLHIFRCALPEQLIGRYHKLIEDYIDLCSTMLVCIRTELRTHLIYHLHQSMMTGNFSIEERAGEIDPSFTDLNHDIVRMHGAAHRYLTDHEDAFVMLGLSSTIDDVLVHDCEKIPAMTAHGAEKMSLSILALQQNLRNVLHRPAAVRLDIARSFFELFTLGLDVLLDRIGLGQAGSFDREVYAHLVRLHVEHAARGADRKILEKLVRENLAALDAALCKRSA